MQLYPFVDRVVRPLLQRCAVPPVEVRSTLRPATEAGAPAEAALTQISELLSYEPMLPPAGLQRGLAYLGSTQRVRSFAQKLVRGEPVDVVSVGGSTTAGVGAYLGNHYSLRFETWLRETFPVRQKLYTAVDERPQNTTWGLTSALPNVKSLRTFPKYEHAGKHVVHVKGVGATPSTIFTLCYDQMVPEGGDLYVVEFALNDDENAELRAGPRQDFERLLRRLLRQPQRPAVVVLAQFAYCAHQGKWYGGDEKFESLVAQYYDIPVLSMRNAVFPYIREKRFGFHVDTTVWDEKMRIKENWPLNGSLEYEQRLLFHNVHHPADQTGHRVLGDLLVGLTRAMLTSEAPPTEDFPDSEPPTMPPMYEGNTDDSPSVCYLQKNLETLVRNRNGWKFEPDKPEAATYGAQKWGWQTSQPGAALEFTVDARNLGKPNDKVRVSLGVLRSWERVGHAEVRCVSGCACAATKLDPLWKSKTSQMTFMGVEVTQHPECVVSLTLLNSTSTEGHHFALRGVLVATTDSFIGSSRYSGDLDERYGQQ